MATKALTPVARRASLGHVSANQAPGRAQDWRQILISQDANTIWHSLSNLVQSSLSDDKSKCDQLTQDIFLELLYSRRFDFYLEQGYSNEEILNDLLSYLTG